MYSTVNKVCHSHNIGEMKSCQGHRQDIGVEVKAAVYKTKADLYEMICSKITLMMKMRAEKKVKSYIIKK